MGWAVGFDEEWKRWRGYGVPAFCDHVGCDAEIHRGLAYACEADECRCGKFYCAAHRYDVPQHTHDAPPSREHPAWAEHVLTHESWRQWREENPEQLPALQKCWKQPKEPRNG